MGGTNGAYRPAAGWGMSRRRFAQLSLGSAAAAALSLKGGPFARAKPRPEPPTTTRAIGGIDMKGHPVPFGPPLDTVMIPDKPLLDSYARRYGEEMHAAGLEPTPADFWFRWLPIPLFDDAIDGITLGTEPDTVMRHLWLMHLVGYFGGVWFGKKLDELTCDPGASPPADCTNPPDGASPEGFAALARYLEVALAAAYDPNPQVPIDRAEFSLRGDPSDPDGVLQALITLYGYNVGYTQAILDPVHRPNPATDCVGHGDTPEQWDPPQNSQVENYEAVFGATFPQFAKEPYGAEPFPPPPEGRFDPVPFLTGDTHGLQVARGLHATAATQLADPTSHYFRILNGLPDASRGTLPLPAAVRAFFEQVGAPVPSDQFLMGGNLIAQQIAASRVGYGTWSIPFFLDVRGWDRRSYREIIGLSIYFVQAVQLSGLACLAAAAQRDEGAARNAVLCSALAQPFGGSYLVGLDDGGSAAYCDRTAAESIPQFR